MQLCLLITTFRHSLLSKYSLLPAQNGIVENSLRILDLCRTPETDSTNTWGSIELRLRTTVLETCWIYKYKRPNSKDAIYNNNNINIFIIIIQSPLAPRFLYRASYDKVIDVLIRYFI